MPKLANPNRSEPRFKIKAHLNFEAKLTNIILLTKPHSCKVLGNEIRKIGYRIIWGWEILYQNWSNPVIALSERLGWPDLNRPISAFLFTCYVLGYGWQKFRWYFVHIWPLLFHKKAILSLPFDTIRGDNRTWKDTRLYQENYTSFAKIPKYLYSIVSIFEHPVQQGKYIYELFSNVSTIQPTIYFYIPSSKQQNVSGREP